MNETLTLYPEATRRRGERCMDDWLLIDGEFAGTPRLAGSAEPSFETLLAWNARLEGGAKFVIASDGQVDLRAELPWDEEQEAPDTSAAAAAGFERAKNLWAQEGGSVRLEPVPPAATPPAQVLPADTESGWNVHPRADGTLVADLAEASGSWQARLLTLPSGGTLALVEIAAIEDESAESRAAVALLLLLAGGALRWARPALRAIDGRAVAVFEIVLLSAPTLAAIADALSALSVACRSVGPEAKALLHEPTAHDYLQVLTQLSAPTLNLQKKEEKPWSR